MCGVGVGVGAGFWGGGGGGGGGERVNNLSQNLAALIKQGKTTECSLHVTGPFNTDWASEQPTFLRRM